MLSHLGIRSRSTRQRQVACHLWLSRHVRVVQRCFLRWMQVILPVGCHPFGQNGWGAWVEGYWVPLLRTSSDLGFGAVWSTQPWFLSVGKRLLVVFPCFGWKATGKPKRFTCRGFLLQLCTSANGGDFWLGTTWRSKWRDPKAQTNNIKSKIYIVR